MRSSLLIFLGMGVMLTAGCTSAQLRTSTVAQSTTLQDIYTQEVMNNIALFISNPDALPFFAFPNQGTTAIQDQGTVTGPGYTAANWVTSPFGLSASRQATENWVLVPVTDPAKLALMRCAYRQAISSCTGNANPNGSFCPNCDDLRREFYGPADPKTRNPRFNEELPCLNSACWLAWGCKEMIPKDCPAHYVGFYHGVYVWFTPEGRDMLTRLTLSILDYAVNDPVQFTKRTKTVEMVVNEDGSINYDDDKGVKVTVTVPIDMSSEAIAALNGSGAYGEFLRRFPNAKEIKDRVIAGLEQHVPDYRQLSIADKKNWWRTAPGLPAIEWRKDIWPEDLKAAVTFIGANRLVPYLIPDEDVLHGPGAFERKGNASDGLQQVGQRLNAALAPGTATGH
jgi:hypothetical protein